MANTNQTPAQKAEADKTKPVTTTGRVRMLEHGTHKDGSKLEAGKEYTLPKDSADMWVHRRQAVHVHGDGTESTGDAPVAGPKGDGTVEMSAAEVAAREKELGLQNPNVNDKKSKGG